MRLGDLAAPPQRDVDGAPGGVHTAARRGGGIEFAEHRDYAPGDDLRHVDWRAFARSDRYTVKRFEQEVHASVTLLLDASASMHIDAGPGPSKMAAARLICASLAHWIIGHGDAVGLVIAGRGIDIAAAGGKAQLRRIITHLASAAAQGSTGFDQLDRTVLRSPERRGTVIAVSDLLAEPALVLAPLVRLRRLGPQVLVVCTLHPTELDLSFPGAVELVCAETQRRDRLDPRVVRGLYRELMQDHLEALRGRAMQGGLGFLQVDLATAPERVVRQVAASLAKRGRSSFAGSRVA